MRPTISVRYDWQPPLIIEGDLMTDSYTIGPPEIFSRRSKAVRELLAQAQQNGGSACNDRFRRAYHYTGTLADMLQSKVRDDATPVVAVDDTDPYQSRGEPVACVLITSEAGNQATFRKDYWDALAHVADEMRYAVYPGPAVAYKDGKPIGAVMPLANF